MNPNETDEPLAELRELSVDPSPGFDERLRRRLTRKETTNHVLWFFWELPAAALLAFVEILYGVLESGRDDRGGKK